MTKEIEIKLLSDDATMPTRERLDVGYDIYSAETLILEPQEKAVIKTDVAVNIPEGYVGLLTSRSGVSSKTHLVIETGKIDAGYQGNLGINIKNDTDLNSLNANPHIFEAGFANYVYDIKNEIIETIYDDGEFMTDVYKINKGDKLAQLVIVPIFTPELVEVKDFKVKSERGSDGFGSTGY